MTTIEELKTSVGGLSKPSKMPGWAFGIPAQECRVGSVLRKVKGSTCSKCYALKGRYVFPNVKEAQYRRLDIMIDDLDEWSENMIHLIERIYEGKSYDDRVFRWLDSGDIQSLEHLVAISDIAMSCPDVRFWLPTREYQIVREYNRLYERPSNLVIRVSSPMVGQALTHEFEHTSSVRAKTGYSCPAKTQGNQCGPCRACWEPSVPHVDYDEI